MVPGQTAAPENDSYIATLPSVIDGKGGQVAIMVQKQVQFDGPFGSTELCPVKQGDRQDQ